MRFAPLNVPFGSHLSHLDRPNCATPHQREPIGLNIRRNDKCAGLAFRQTLYDVSCHDWEWETKPEGRGYGTRNNRNVARQYLGLPVNGDRRTDAVHASRSTLKGPISSQTT